jgi:PBP1b-binding outer membrane lipoprotein LpoB
MMHKFCLIAITAVLLTACASLPRYNAPFPEVDSNGDGVIEWQEFKTRYSDSDAKAFLEADRNKNGDITPEEWQFFIEMQAS